MLDYFPGTKRRPGYPDNEWASTKSTWIVSVGYMEKKTKIDVNHISDYSWTSKYACSFKEEHLKQMPIYSSFFFLNVFFLQLNNLLNNCET